MNVGFSILDAHDRSQNGTGDDYISDQAAQLLAGMAIAEVGATVLGVVQGSVARKLARKWRAHPVGDPKFRHGCEVVAEGIQKIIGGNRHVIKPKPPARVLDKMDGVSTSWFEHHVVVKDGKVFDAFTGHTGQEIAQYKARFEYWDVIDFGF